jgi:hypothetical protein
MVRLMYYSTTEYGKNILHDFYGGHQVFNPFADNDTRCVFFEYPSKQDAADHVYLLLQTMSLLEGKDMGEKHHFVQFFFKCLETTTSIRTYSGVYIQPLF